MTRLTAGTLTYDAHRGTVKLADQTLTYDIADRHASTPSTTNDANTRPLSSATHSLQRVRPPKRWVVQRRNPREACGMVTTDVSFERAYTQHLPAVSGYLYRRVERRFVEDLAADVFAIAWRRRATVTVGEELPWLYRIAANVVSNHRRKMATGVSLIAALRPADSAPSAEDIVVADASLAAAWRQLRAPEREIIALALVEELPASQIALALKISANAASIRLHRAKKRLAELLSADNSLDATERSAASTTYPRYEQPS